MSGLFQRIARRRGDESVDASAPTTVDQAGLGTPDGPANGGPDPSPAPAKRYIGAPAPDATAPPAVTEQATELFSPATDQPTVAQPAVPDEPVVPEQPAAPAQPATGEAPAAATPAAPAAEAEVERKPGFRERGRMRRRLRYLRRLRELQVRDLGGLAFDLRRFERKRDDLVAQKVDQIRACDDELHALEQALDERRDIRDVRAPGIGGACPRCFALFGSNDRFCAHCGAALGGMAQGPAQVAAPLPPPPAPAPAPPVAPPAGAPHEPTPPQ